MEQVAHLESAAQVDAAELSSFFRSVAFQNPMALTKIYTCRADCKPTFAVRDLPGCSVEAENSHLVFLPDIFCSLYLYGTLYHNFSQKACDVQSICPSGSSSKWFKGCPRLG